MRNNLMPDFIDEYHTGVHRRLRSQAGKTLAPGGELTRLLEVVFLPSFHPEAILQVSTASTTTLRFTTFKSSVWYSENGHGPKPERQTEIVQLAEGRVQKFWEAVDALRPETLQSTSICGVDGMSVTVCHSTVDAVHEISSWSPSEETPQGRLVLLLYRLAWDVLVEPISIQRLEQLHGYLGLGLPTRWVEGNIRQLRIFGGLSTQWTNELQTLFSTISRNEPLIVDMSNFDGMGTLLYPMFFEFAGSHHRLAWIASAYPKQQLAEAGIDGETVFQSHEDAADSVRKD
jgi:hypothetical protein